MTTDRHPDLFALLRGELGNSGATAAGAHLDGCADCRDELAQVAVGHALMTGSARTLRRATPVVLPAVPALAAVPARRGRWLRPLGVVAATAAVVAGTFTATRYAERVDQRDRVAVQPARPTPTTSAPVAQRSALLQPVEGHGGGRVVMAAEDHAVRMSIETHDLPAILRGQFYYVWLFDPGTGKMLPLGVVGPRGDASFEVPDSLVDRYQVVDVSLERDDGDPAHSVTSVLRADYGPVDGLTES